MKQERQNYFWLVMVLVAGGIFRLWLAPQSMHLDLIINAGWGQWINAHGPKDFYENNIWTYAWPTQPTLASLLYGLSFHVYGWLNTLFACLPAFARLSLCLK